MSLNAKALIGICIFILKLLEKNSMEILWIKSIFKDSPSGWGGQTLANTYNKLSINYPGMWLCIKRVLEKQFVKETTSYQ